MRRDIEKFDPEFITRVLLTELDDNKNDSGAKDICGYLRELLYTLWEDGEGFSGKRPFGNSGWEFDLYHGLAKGGFINATLDEDGYLDSFPDDQRVLANRIIFACINQLCTVVQKN